MCKILIISKRLLLKGCKMDLLVSCSQEGRGGKGRGGEGWIEVIKFLQTQTDLQYFRRKGTKWSWKE